MTSETFAAKDWGTLISVAYLGYGRHGTCHGHHFDGSQKLMVKLNLYLQFL